MREEASRKKNLSADIVELIKEKIIDGHLQPGDRIVETKLARDLQVSQTPIREAIRQLAGEGVVNIVPNRGPFVRTFSAKDILEIYTMRAVLEGMAIRFAVQNASNNDIRHLEQFYEEMKQKLYDDSVDSLFEDSGYIHYYIFRLSRHETLFELFDLLFFRIRLVNRWVGKRYSKEREVSEHWELIHALKHGDPDHAEKMMREHIRRAYEEFVGSVKLEQSELAQVEWLW